MSEQRVLKFRAWVNVPNANTMLENIDLKEVWESGRAYEDYGTSRYEAENISGIKWTFNDLIFMQYTGLKDVSGKEIYEGDILSMENCTAKVVFWEVPPAFGLDYYHNEDEWCSDWNLADDSERMEIIGNIYEHAHLLEREA